MRLNGWQRLWVVVMAVSLAISMAVAWMTAPPDPQAQFLLPPFPAQGESEEAQARQLAQYRERVRAAEAEARRLGRGYRLRWVLEGAGLWLAGGALVYALGFSV